MMGVGKAVEKEVYHGMSDEGWTEDGLHSDKQVAEVRRVGSPD